MNSLINEKSKYYQRLQLFLYLEKLFLTKWVSGIKMRLFLKKHLIMNTYPDPYVKVVNKLLIRIYFLFYGVNLGPEGRIFLIFASDLFCSVNDGGVISASQKGADGF